MRILVTGGSGYLGSHLTDRLQQAGHTVRVLDIQPTTSVTCLGPSCDAIQGSVTDAALVTQAVRGIDVVYHLAWSFGSWRAQPELRPEAERQEMLENLMGTVNLLDAALRAGVRHFVFSSSAVVYGPTGPVRVDEEHRCNPERTAIGGPLYGITKLACERLSLVYHRRGLPVTVFRLHGVFSEDSLAQFGGMIKEAQIGDMVKAVRGAGGEYAHIEDVLRPLLLAIDNPQVAGEVFNLAGSHTYHDPEVARCIVQMVESASKIQLIEDPMQGMVSVSVEKLRRRLAYQPESGEFLTGLIRKALQRTRS